MKYTFKNKYIWPFCLIFRSKKRKITIEASDIFDVESTRKVFIELKNALDELSKNFEKLIKTNES